MQREKDRLNRYFQSKERTAKQHEDHEKRAQDLLKKKATKLAKIEDKKKKEFKMIREKAELHEEQRHSKLKSVQEAINDHNRHGQELYFKHLDEVKSWNEQKLKRQREACEISYRRHQENMAKSMGKQEAKYLQEVEAEAVTQRNLQELQAKIQIGWTRSQIRKEEMKHHAKETLSNFETVVANHMRLQEEEEN